MLGRNLGVYGLYVFGAFSPSNEVCHFHKVHTASVLITDKCAVKCSRKPYDKFNMNPNNVIMATIWKINSGSTPHQNVNKKKKYEELMRTAQGDP